MKKINLSLLIIISLILLVTVNAATVSHPASEIEAGTFQAGTYTFPNDLVVSGSITLGDVPESSWPSETDPTVLTSVKDGVSWSEVSGIPAGFADDVDNVGITSESDPQVGAVTSGKWCRGDGSAVQCNQNPPSGGHVSGGLYGHCTNSPGNYFNTCRSPTWPAYCQSSGGSSTWCTCLSGYSMKITGQQGSGDSYDDTWHTCYKN